MSGITMRGPAALGKRGMLLVGALLTSIAMYFAVTASPAAAAEPFCTQVTLQPFGHNGDRCWAPWHYSVIGETLVTFERAGCVDIANGANELMFSWVCGAAHSSPAAAAEINDFNHEGVPRKGVIRNNSLSFTGKFSGSQVCSNSAEC
jgi:hypothetical protein